MKANPYLDLILQQGESLHVEFKERLASLDTEMVAFANAAGGAIFLGVGDDGAVKGIELNNQIRSQIQDIAHNCDPSIPIHLIHHSDYGIVEIRVEEGTDKPYRCKEGFFLRVGPNAQKLKRDEIVSLINQSGKIRFDENFNQQFKYPEEFSLAKFNEYLKTCGIKTKLPTEDILFSLNIAQEIKGKLVLNNAGILFFSENPQKYFPEAYVTCVKYEGIDRFAILDKKDFYGSLTHQIEEAMQFVLRHISMQISIGKATSTALGMRHETYDYPIAALREAIINAITHRDYGYDAAHIYVHLFSDRIEIENPGGLYHGLSIEKLGTRSVRRNRLIADLLHRIGYIERVGSGFDRMKHALEENNNPPLEVSATNFFVLKFKKRIATISDHRLSDRQYELLHILQQRSSITKGQAAQLLNVSDDTVIRELRTLLKAKLIIREGKGKATRYLSQK